MTVRNHASGFSLLELLIALAILATSLTILMGTMANSSQQAVFANRLTQASLLARSKMTDLEYLVMEDGFSNADRSFRGDFRNEGYPDITWEASVEPVEIPQDAQDRVLGQINAQLFGGVDSEGAFQGNAAFSSMLPTLVGQLPQMVNQIGHKVRRIQLTVMFEFGARQYPIEVTQYVVDQETKDFQMFSLPDAFSGGE